MFKIIILVVSFVVLPFEIALFLLSIYFLGLI